MKFAPIAVLVGFTLGRATPPINETRAADVPSISRSFKARQDNSLLFNLTLPESSQPGQRFNTPRTGTADFEPGELASEDLWNSAKCKGTRFADAMLGTDEDAGKAFDSKKTPPSMRSEWQGDLQDDLKKWGWRDSLSDQSSCDFEYWNIGDELKGLGLSATPKEEGGDNECFRVEHGDDKKKDDKGERVPIMKQTYTVGQGGSQKTYTATGAYYQGGVNHKGGAIFAQYLESPKHAAKKYWYREPREDELPDLRSVADVFWGFWFKGNSDVANLRYIWVQSIANAETQKIMATALKNKNVELTAWPGTTFSLETDEGKALLGSPNGLSFGYFLISHKAELGQKWIPKVQIFIADGDEDVDFASPDMLFYVEKSPDKKLKEATDSRSGKEVLERRVGPRNIVRVHRGMEGFKAKL